MLAKSRSPVNQSKVPRAVAVAPELQVVGEQQIGQGGPVALELAAVVCLRCGALGIALDRVEDGSWRYYTTPKESLCLGLGWCILPRN